MPEKRRHIPAALVLGSHTMGLAIIRSLGQMGIPVYVVYYEQKDMGYRSKYVRECVFTDSPESSPEKFLDILMRFSEKYGRCVVFPSDDASLLVVAKYKKLLSDYHFVACPDWDLVDLIVDKKKTYELAEKAGIPAPQTFTPTNESEVVDYCQQIGFPCLIKPCVSHRYYDCFKKKVTRVDNADQALRAYREADSCSVEVMVQEFIPGADTQGANYNSFVSGESEPVEFISQKVRLSPPNFGVPRVVKSKWIPEVAALGKRAVSAFGYKGYSCTEFKQDQRDGAYKLMELNGRHNRSSLLSLKCGINFPFIEYKFHVDGFCEQHMQSDEECLWIDEFRDLYQTFASFKDESLGFKKIIEPYLKNHVFAVFDRQDLTPFTTRIQGLFRQVVRG